MQYLYMQYLYMQYLLNAEKDNPSVKSGVLRQNEIS